MRRQDQPAVEPLLAILPGPNERVRRIGRLDRQDIERGPANSTVLQSSGKSVEVDNRMGQFLDRPRQLPGESDDCHLPTVRRHHIAAMKL